MRIILGSRVLTSTEYKDEKELEKVVESRPEVILNEDVIYLPKKFIQTLGGAGTEPEAIAMDLSTERWYIIEVELAVHGVWNHIAPQVSKQAAAANNSRTKRELGRIFLAEVETKERWKKKLVDKGIPETRMQEAIERILGKDPVIVIPIDHKPTDLDEWAKTQRYEVVPIVIEKYVEVGNNEVAYQVHSDQLVASPEPPSEEKVAERPAITEEDFLRQCDKPGQIIYPRLKELAGEKKHEFKPSTQSFSYYVVWRGGRFCPLTLWPKGVTIYKWNLTEKNGMTPQAIASFREGIMRIGDLMNKYDTMQMPGLSTREGELSDYEINEFMTAFSKLVESTDR